jgi:hypothetical protein
MTQRLAPSANFKNPLGLIGRMLLSRKRAAYAALIHEAMWLAAKPVDALLRKRDTRLVKKSHEKSEPVLLVVGAPRSGTTLVYQTLARYLDVSYFSNLTSFFPRSAIAGTRMFGWLAGKPSADFHNFYGQTAGLNGPNHGFTIWNQWLGEDRYVPRTDLSTDEMKAMQKFFAAWSITFQKPLLNKNNRNTACLDQLSRALPSAVFIVVRRNPLLVAQSSINARAQVQGDKTVGWGLHANSQSDAGDALAYVDDVCDQILQIEQELDEQLAHIPADRIVEITYEGFCESPADAIAAIAAAVPGVRVHTELVQHELKPFQASSGVSLTAEEQQRLMKRLTEKRRKTAAAVAAPH